MREILTRKGLPLVALTVALALGCAIGIGHIACVIGLHVPFDPNEGWNAYFADMAVRTGSPYPAADSFLTNNYPPLSFYFVGALARLFGGAIVVGRFVSLFALAAVAAGIESALKRMGCTRWEALFGALLFVAAVMLTSDYAGMDDPQMLGHAISLAALLLILRERAKPLSTVAAAGLFVAAIFVKHNLIVLPLAVSIWLLIVGRSRAVLFLAVGTLLAAAALAAFHLSFGFSLLSRVASPRLYSVANIGGAVRAWLPLAVVPLPAAMALVWLAPRDRFAWLALIYAALAVAIGIAFAGGDGVDTNVFFDADIALSLCAGLFFHHLRAQRLLSGISAVAFAIPLAIAAASLDADWLSADYWLAPMTDEARTSGEEIALIRSANGPVLCEMLSLCYWAGKPPEVDVFNTGEAFATGTRSDTPLASLIAKHRYALIAFEKNEPFPLTARIETALKDNYRVIRNDEGRVFYAPR